MLVRPQWAVLSLKMRKSLQLSKIKITRMRRFKISKMKKSEL